MSYVISHPDIEGTAVIPERALPHYADRGWVLEDRTAAEAEAPERPRLKKPARSASAAAWTTYAVAIGVDNGGMSFEDAVAATRDELADKYSPIKPDPKPTPKTAPAVTPSEEN